MVEVNITVFF